MTDDELIAYLAGAYVGTPVPVDYNADLALAALARRLLRLEESVAELVERNDLYRG